jgi:hypothetical protein
MYDHERDVDRQNESHSAFGDWQMSATVEDVGSGGADCEFYGEEGELAVFEQAGHERVSFGGDIQAQPKQCKLSIEPIERKQE